MSAWPRAARLIASIALAADLPELALDDSGACTIQFDDGLTLHFQADHHDSALIVFARCGSLPEPCPAPLLMTLMRANRFWIGSEGTTLSLSDDAPAQLLIALRWRLMLDTGDADHALVGEQLLSMLAVTRQWRDWLRHKAGPEALAGPPEFVDFA